MPDPIRSSTTEAPAPSAPENKPGEKDEPRFGSSPRFVPLAGNRRGGVYLNEKNEVVPWQDGSGWSEMLNNEFGKVAAMTYGTLVAAVALGPLARGIKGVAQAAWRVAQSAWAWVTRAATTPQGTEVIRNTVECVEVLVPGTPPPTTKVGFQCAGAQKVKEILKDHLDESAQ